MTKLIWNVNALGMYRKGFWIILKYKCRYIFVQESKLVGQLELELQGYHQY